MSEEKDFFKTCFNTVAGLEVTNESQAIAKEVVLSEIENLQQENQQLKECYCNRTDCSGRIKNSRKYDSLYQKYNKQLDNWNKLKEWLNSFHKLSEFEQWEIVNKMQEIEQGSDSNEKD